MARNRHKRGAHRWMTQGLTLTLALALLLWVKLRMVTNVTRTAYAEPAKKHVQPNADLAKPSKPAPAPQAQPSLVD